MISCDYLRCRVITVRLHWINSDIKQICPLGIVSTGLKLATLRFTVNYGNPKWFTENRKWSRYDISKPNLYRASEKMFAGLALQYPCVLLPPI